MRKDLALRPKALRREVTRLDEHTQRLTRLLAVLKAPEAVNQQGLLRFIFDGPAQRRTGTDWLCRARP
jgi:branched-subunit amino acid aminotransferase/4-amino-4-deoxychorismate lyase